MNMNDFIRFIAYFRLKNYISQEHISSYMEKCFLNAPYEKVLLNTEIFAAICIIVISLFLTLFAGKKLKFFVFVLGCAGLGYGFLYQTVPETVKYDIDLGLEEPVKIVQMSDMHFNTTFSYSNNLAVKKCNEEKPDIVCLTGDYITNIYDTDSRNTEIPKDFFLMIRKIKCDRIYAVYGNHDECLNKETADKEFNDSGAEIIEGKTVKIQKNFYICGAEYYGVRNKYIRKILKKLPQNSKAVILTHNPTCVLLEPEKMKNLKDKKILFLTGHTHGGQIVPKEDDRVKIAKDKFYIDILNGMKDIGDSRVYISKGTGTSHLPFRFNAKPEITVFNVK